MLSSMFWHCSSIQFIFAFFMPFLISWLAALYCLTPSASFFFFFNSLRLSHRSSKSAVIQGFLTGRCLPRISLAVLVRPECERCKFPSYYCVEGFCYFGVLQLHLQELYKSLLRRYRDADVPREEWLLVEGD
ncbi:hypothetical protein NP493_567g03007 [Ridgeia piscesae]|uniref:Uncharacterized protein n=1 Tax=Ridgeia piscesae TaxID=27915 RepID=A0AAD9KUM1_RIDPI|nr:hypothetical protein NP493_567g03007 [Ridgeia piscesae]